MTGTKRTAAHRKGRIAGLLFAVYMISLLLGQVAMTGYALDEVPGPALTETAVTKDETTETKEDGDTAKNLDLALEETEYVPEPLCGIPEHTHSAKCYDMDGYRICGKEEHQHDETCYPACGIEAHKHNEDCYDVDGNLICEKEEHQHDEYCYPTCGKPEHVHTAECLNADGELVCGLERHIHGPECCPVRPTEPEEEAQPEEDPEPDPEENPEEDPKEEVDDSSKTQGHPNWLPAQCGIPEHTHTAACRDENGLYICGMVEHSHGRDCYLPKDDTTQKPEEAPEAGESQEEEPKPEEPVTEEPEVEEPKDEDTEPQGKPLYCGLEEHAHSESCEDAEGNLICGKEAHQHDESCYVNPEEAQPEEKTLYCGKEEHTHGDGCYDENGQLTCTLEEHTHDDNCYVNPDKTQSEEKVLYCGKEEHTHGDGCYDENGQLTCALEEHTHTDECYVNPDAPVTNCGFEEHVHTDACYDENHENIICGKVEHTHTAECFRPVYCDQVAHKHSALCLNENGERKCGMEEHTHTESCFVQVPEGMLLTCGQTAHTHTEDCYDENGQLTCTLAEHEHTEECFSPILEGAVYYPVTDPNQLDPDTAYLVMGTEEETNFLLSAQLGTQPVNAVEGVDAEGKPCFALTYGEQPVAMMAMALAPEEEDAPAEAGEAAEPAQLAEEIELSNDLIWVPGAENTQALTNAENADTLVEISSGANGLAATLTLDEESVSLDEVAVFATNANARALPTCPEGCDFDKYLVWKAPSDAEDKVTNNINPFGDALAYNLFLLGDLYNYGDTHGNAAVGGNITQQIQGVGYEAGSNFDYAANLTAQNDIGLLLGGDAVNAAKNVEVRNGSVIGHNDTQINMDNLDLDEDHYHVASEADIEAYFTTAKSWLEGQNSRLYSHFKTTYNTVQSPTVRDDMSSQLKDHEGRVRYVFREDTEDPKKQLSSATPVTTDGNASNADLLLIGQSHEYNVFNIKASMLKRTLVGDGARGLYLDVPFGSYTVINVTDDITDADKVMDFGSKLWYKDSSGKYHQQPYKTEDDNYKQTQRTIYNFAPTIKKATVNVQGLFVFASILAPDMDMEVAEGKDFLSLQGTIVLNNLGSKGGSSNSVMKNTFEASGAASFRKFVKCESESNAHQCKIVGLNHPPEGTTLKQSWQNYKVDVTLTSVDHVGGEAREYTLYGMTMDGELYGQEYEDDGVTPKRDETGNLVAKKYYLAPGNYRVSVEQVHRRQVNDDGTPVIVDGKEVWDIITTGDGSIPDHFFSGAYFTKDETLPEDLQFMVAGNLVLNIAPYIYEPETIINVYRTEKGIRVPATKQWVTTEIDSTSRLPTQVLVSPPEGTETNPAQVTFRLYRKLYTETLAEDGKTTIITWKDGEDAEPTRVEGVEDQVLNAKSNWYTEWRLLPPEEVVDDTTYKIKYFVKEQKGYKGYAECVNPDSNVKWWENTIGKNALETYSPCYNESTGQWVIKNEQADMYSFKVTKQWEGLDENETPPEITVQLYQLAAATEPSAEDIIKRGQVLGEPVTLTVDQDGNWTYTWDNLPKKVGTQNCYYAVKELTTVFGYGPEYGTPVISGDDITQAIINKPTDVQPGSILVKKEWQNAEGTSITPPAGASATMQLWQQKGAKIASEGNTVPITIILNDSDQTQLKTETYNVLSGTTFQYSITMWHLGLDWNQDAFTQMPEGVEVQKTFSGWISYPIDKIYNQTKASGSLVANSETTLTFTAAKKVYNGETITVGSYTVEAPQFHADYESHSYTTDWETTWTPYGEKVLSAKNNWSDYWMDLPLEGEENGTTYSYRYCVEEKACSPAAISTSYTFNGNPVDNPKELEDFTGGTVIVTNQMMEGGPELPKAGGMGTQLYTLGGLLLSVAAGFLLMYKHGKRRKEDFVS